MPRALPLVLSERDLPLAELLASRLDGELFGLDSGFCPIDEIVSPAHRAVVATIGLPARLIAERLTAAWIWGAVSIPPEHPQFCVTQGARVGHPSSVPFAVREVVLHDSDLSHLAGVQVTSPTRTAMDIARFSDDWSVADRDTVRSLMTIGSFTLGHLEKILSCRRKLPAKKRALARLSRLGQT